MIKKMEINWIDNEENGDKLKKMEWNIYWKIVARTDESTVTGGTIVESGLGECNSKCLWLSLGLASRTARERGRKDGGSCWFRGTLIGSKGNVAGQTHIDWGYIATEFGAI